MGIEKSDGWRDRWTVGAAIVKLACQTAGHLGPGMVKSSSVSKNY